MKYVVISQKQGKDKHGSDINILENNYIKIFTDLLNIPTIPIPNDLSSLKIIEGACGIILTGGGNIDKSQEKRNIIETKLIECAINKNIPLFGICRGMQIIAKYFGGDIYKISGHSLKGKTHSVNIEFNNKKWKEYVNSYHDYAVTIKDTELVPFAINDCIEGVYHPKFLIKGVQWHPERELISTKISKLLLEQFKDAIYNTSCGEGK